VFRCVLFVEARLRLMLRKLKERLAAEILRLSLAPGTGIEPMSRTELAEGKPTLRLRLLESFNQIQVRESPNVTVHVGLGVSRYRYAADSVDSSSIGRGEFFPGFSLSS
jgi:hypothetical protein